MRGCAANKGSDRLKPSVAFADLYDDGVLAELGGKCVREDAAKQSEKGSRVRPRLSDKPILSAEVVERSQDHVFEGAGHLILGALWASFPCVRWTN